MRLPPTDPRNAEIMAATDRVNHLAECAPGFVWRLAAGTTPTVEEALARLGHLRTHGPGPSAFTLRVRFDPTGHLSQRA